MVIPAASATVFALVAGLACGGKTANDTPAAPAGDGAGGSGGGAPPACLAETDTGAPTLSADCAIVARSLDPALTCASSTCPIAKALDSFCESGQDGPSLAATADGALLLTAAATTERGTRSRLVTVEKSASRVEDVTFFPHPSLALAATVSGVKWLFGGRTPGVVGVRGTDAGWKSSTVVAAPDDGDAYLTDVKLVDGGVGYLTYYTALPDALPNPSVPHLVTWDGACWTDQSFDATELKSLVVGVDAEQRPWVVWGDAATASTQTIHLRRPDGGTEDVFTDVPADLFGMAMTPPRLLPGGLDGTATYPVVAVEHDDGIRLATRNPLPGGGWSERVLPESAGGVTRGDCPGTAYTPSMHPCEGADSCTEQLRGASTGFDLVRTRSGETFAAWVVYSSESSFALEQDCFGGEMPQCACVRAATGTTGTADLVVARLTASETTLTRFRFELGGVLASVKHDVAMATRGDTLLVAATVSGGFPSPLTYLEIDSARWR